MDIQAFLDAVSDAARMSRKHYHLTLGALSELVENNPDASVIVDGERGLGSEDSYRGYYADLSFAPANEPTPASVVREMCSRALADTYTGYKGGDFRYGPDTPLWFAPYGRCGPAIIDGEVRDGAIHLTTRDVEV